MLILLVVRLLLDVLRTFYVLRTVRTIREGLPSPLHLFWRGGLDIHVLSSVAALFLCGRFTA